MEEKLKPLPKEIIWPERISPRLTTLLVEKNQRVINIGSLNLTKLFRLRIPEHPRPFLREDGAPESRSFLPNLFSISYELIDSIKVKNVLLVECFGNVE